MEIRKYEPGDEYSIIKLFKVCFNQEMSLKVWKWRFQNNPFSSELFIHLMWEGDKLIGHYAVSPVDMIISGKKEKTALSMTTMTHPDYSGKGVFTKLAKSVYEDLTNKNYIMVWGFPNVNSHYGFIKNLGWKDISIIPMMSLNKEKLRSNAVSEEFIIEENFSKDLISPFLNTSTNNKIRIAKSIHYLKWRYFSNPSYKYKVLSLPDCNSALIYKLISFNNNEYEVDIMEISHNNEYETLEKLIVSLFAAEAGSNIKKINIWKSIFSNYRFYYEKLGFTITTPLTYLSYLKLGDKNQFIQNYSDWEIGFGYSDVY